MCTQRKKGQGISGLPHSPLPDKENVSTMFSPQGVKKNLLNTLDVSVGGVTVPAPSDH